MLQYPDADRALRQNICAEVDALKSAALLLLNKCNVLISQSEPLNDSLVSGSLGAVLYHYEAYRVFGGNADSNRAKVLLEGVIRKLNDPEPGLFNPSYANGMAGLGYLLQHFCMRGFTDLSMETEFAEIDHYLFLQASTQIKKDRNDWLHGSFGVIFYFLSREQNQIIRQYLDILLPAVLKRVDSSTTGTLVRNFFTHSDSSRINLSLSHGQAGFLLILIKAWRAGFRNRDIANHINQSLTAILEFHSVPEGARLSFFPFEVMLKEQKYTHNNRLAWCYGDLNLALLLYEAANIFNNERYKSVADRIGVFTVSRTTESSTLCSNSHFCHGTSGLAQTYKRLNFLRPMAEYEHAYLRWINQTVTLLQRDMHTGIYTGRELAFLEGLLGPAMVLLSFIHEKDLDWPKYWLL